MKYTHFKIKVIYLFIRLLEQVIYVFGAFLIKLVFYSICTLFPRPLVALL